MSLRFRLRLTYLVFNEFLPYWWCIIVCDVNKFRDISEYNLLGYFPIK